jgi:hypothetical protein
VFTAEEARGIHLLEGGEAGAPEPKFELDAKATIAAAATPTIRPMWAGDRATRTTKICFRQTRIQLIRMHSASPTSLRHKDLLMHRADDLETALLHGLRSSHRKVLVD